MNEAQLIGLTASLRGSGIEHRCWLRSDGQWIVVASSPTNYTSTQLQNLATEFGVVAKTNRAEFS